MITFGLTTHRGGHRWRALGQRKTDGGAKRGQGRRWARMGPAAGRCWLLERRSCTLWSWTVRPRYVLLLLVFLVVPRCAPNSRSRAHPGFYGKLDQPQREAPPEDWSRCVRRSSASGSCSQRWRPRARMQWRGDSGYGNSGPVR